MLEQKERSDQVENDSQQHQNTTKRQKIVKALCDPTTYCIFAIALLFVTCAVIDVVFGLFIGTKIAAFILLFVATYTTGALKMRGAGEKHMRRAYFLMIIIYTYFVISATLLDASLGREKLQAISDIALRREYYNEWHVNLMPFHTVKTIYIDALKNGAKSIGYVLFNAIGNLLLLAPFAVLIPATSKKLSKVYFLLPILLVSTLAIEALQYVFMRGSCDIDDIIFNFVGATAIWTLTKIPGISRIMKKVMFPFS